MASTTTPRVCEAMSRHFVRYPVKALAAILQGCIVATDASGFLVCPSAKATGLLVKGVAGESKTGGASNGDVDCLVRHSQTGSANLAYRFFTTADANAVGKQHVGEVCYLEDNQTVTMLATGSSAVGTVADVKIEDGVTAVYVFFKS